MHFVSKNRVIIALLLSIIFGIIFYYSILVKYIHENMENNFQPKLFIINMDKDKDRFRKIMKFYNNSDVSTLPLNRYSAIVGKNVPIDKWLTSDSINELRLIEKNGYRTHHHSLTRGGIGCFLSHYYLAKTLLSEKDVSMYLIFEDDSERE